MRLDAHQAALRAAAKVAFGVALLGCGGSTETGTQAGTEPEATSGGDETYGTTQDDLRRRPRKPKPASCDSGSASCAQMTDRTAKEACCEGTLKQAFPNGDDWQTRATDASAEVLACCQVVAEKVDRGWQSQGWNDDAGAFTWPRTQCCSLLNWQGSMACTPWGPPTPPPAHWRARRPARAEAELAA